MTEKRKHPRYSCKIEALLNYYPGNPDEVDPETAEPVSIKGYILDISAGGLFLITSEKVGINSPAKVVFATSKKEMKVSGRIIRTGRLKDNPSEVAQKFSHFAEKGENYIAVKFDNHLENFSEDDI